MKIVNPLNTTHSITFVPRKDIESVSLSLFNEFNSVETSVVNSLYFEKNYITIIFDFNFNEGDLYQVKITENDNVIYRGKLFATSQNTQEYKDLIYV